jgi:hypothetical protein
MHACQRGSGVLLIAALGKISYARIIQIFWQRLHFTPVSEPASQPAAGPLSFSYTPDQTRPDAGGRAGGRAGAMSLSSSEDSSMGSEDLDRLVAELAGGAGRRVDAAAPDEYDDDDAAGGVAGQLEEEGGDDEEESDNGDSLENLPAKFSKMAAGYRRQSTSSIASEDSRLMAALLMKTKNAQFSPEKPEPAKAPADTRRTLGSPRMFDSESSQSSDEEAGDDEVRRPYAKPSIAPPSTLKSLSVNMSDSLGLRASPVTTRFPASSPLASAKRPAVSSRDRAPATQPPPDQNPTQEPVLDRYEEDEGDQPYGVDASLLSAVNRGLTGRGHSEISLRDPTSVLETFLDVLQDLDERGTALQKAMLSGVQSRPDASDEAKNAIALLHRKLAAAEARTSMVSEDLEVVKKKAAEEKKSLQAANANLVSQLKHSENRVRAKEVTNQKLMHRLQGDVSRERERTHRNQKLKVVDPATVQSLTEEVDDLRAEISALAERLRERENYILRLEGASVAASSRGLGEHEAHRHGRLSELQAALEERDRNIVALRKIQGQLHRRIAAAEAALAERDAEREDSTSKIEQLEEELKLRPSTRAWREQQFRIEVCLT